MHTKPIGIIGGAGPTAGAFLFQKVVEMSQKKYGCTQDANFPYIMLLSYPFADMLGKNVDRGLVQSQLHECINLLVQNKVKIAAIACNTLHGFLPPTIESLELVHFILETKKFLDKMDWKKPLILCSSTSAESRLHFNYFDCYYPDQPTQKKIDDLIDLVTRGCCLREASSYLDSLIEAENGVVLGCTELSVIHEAVPISYSKVCNPIAITAERLCELVFEPK